MDPAADRLTREALAAQLEYFLGLDADESRLRCEELDAVEVEEWREECAGIERDVRWLEMRVAARPPRRPSATSRSLRMRARESHRGRAGHRRGTRSTRAGPSDDDGPGEPPPAAPRLALAPKPKAIYAYGALALDADLWREVNS